MLDYETRSGKGKAIASVRVGRLVKMSNQQHNFDVAPTASLQEIPPDLRPSARCIDGWDYEIANWAMLPKRPLVSVWMITYQHAHFLRQALDSVLIQEGALPYEICLGEDGSTDGTREICVEYARKYPETIRLFLRDRANPARRSYYLPHRHNGASTLASCRGEFIAMCEGDDYWTDRHKLQKQVQLLQRDADAAFCFHNTAVISADQPSRTYLAHNAPPNVTIDDIVGDWIAMTSSIVFRRSRLPSLPLWSKDILNADWMIQMLLAAQGSVLYIDEVMSVYRRHPGGISRVFVDADLHTDGLLRLYGRFNRWSKGKYWKPVYKRMSALYLSSAIRHRSQRRYALFARKAFLHLRFSLFLGVISLANSVRHLVLPIRWNAALSQTRSIKTLAKILKRNKKP
jgi:glycosyltransferase involved in cell wall biosynthesis